jgi:hypothetical protein
MKIGKNANKVKYFFCNHKLKFLYINSDNKLKTKNPKNVDFISQFKKNLFDYQVIYFWHDFILVQP